jgi:hypothetical protein
MSASAEQLQQLVGFFTVSEQGNRQSALSQNKSNASKRARPEPVTHALTASVEDSDFVRF